MADAAYIIMVETSGNVYVINGSGYHVQVSSGTGINVPAADGKIAISATDTALDYLGNKLGTGLGISGTNLYALGAQIKNVYSWGTSTDAPTATSSLIFCTGSLTGQGTIAFTNAPFSNTNSYIVNAYILGTGSAGNVRYITVADASKQQVTGGSFNINIVSTSFLLWYAIGV